MRARFWLIDVPARAVDLWFRAYWLLVTVITVGCFLVMATSLLLYSFGIRWGW